MPQYREDIPSLQCISTERNIDRNIAKTEVPKTLKTMPVVQTSTVVIWLVLTKTAGPKVKQTMHLTFNLPKTWYY